MTQATQTPAVATEQPAVVVAQSAPSVAVLHNQHVIDYAGEKDAKHAPIDGEQPKSAEQLAAEKAAEEIAVLKGMAVDTMETIGNADAQIWGVQQETQVIVQEKLVQMRNAGFKVEYLDTKHEIRQAMESALRLAYVLNLPNNKKVKANNALVDAAKKYIAYRKDAIKKDVSPSAPTPEWFAEQKLPVVAIPKSSVWNKFSQIRAFFVENDGTKTVDLDLYGNAERKPAEKKTSDKGTGKSAAPTPEQPKQDATVQKAPAPVQPATPAPEKDVGSASRVIATVKELNMKGTGGMRIACEQFLKQNEGVPALEKLSEAVTIVLNIINAMEPKK